MASSASTATSLLTPIGYQSGDCGYCKNEETSQRTPDSRASYYVRTKCLTPEHYHDLMDRGWRRSGSLLYLPDAARSCCTHYTIRLPASQFKPQRDQRQTLNRWNRFVLGDEYIKQEAIKFPKTKEQKKQAQDFNLLPTIHASELSSLRPTLTPAHRHTITLEPSTFTEEKYALFAHYQSAVHHEPPSEITRNGFKRFLCDSPLTRSAGPPALGSYHQLYRLDDRLIAMAVLDLLPRGVSAVYFIYHTDFEKFSLGKLSAVREASLALEGGYEWYYMGYYIHSCKKMRYKAEFQPQFVLDLETFGWDRLDGEMKDLMEREGYASMSRERRRLGERKDYDEVLPGDDPSAITSSTTPEEDEDDRPILHPDPITAANSDLSLLTLGMPGVLTPAQLREQVDLDAMRVSIGSGHIVRVDRLVAWERQRDVTREGLGNEEDDELVDKGTLKGLFAEFAAAVGPRVAREGVVDFG